MVPFHAGLCALLCAQVATATTAAVEDVGGAWRMRMQTCQSAHAEGHGPQDAAYKNCIEATQKVVDKLEEARWPEASAYSRVISDEAAAPATPPAVALQLAKQGVALAPTSPLAQLVLCRAYFYDHQYAAALGTLSSAALGSSAILQRRPAYLALPLWGALWAAVVSLTALVLLVLAEAGPQLAHDLAHALPMPQRPLVVWAMAAVLCTLWCCAPISPVMLLALSCLPLLLHIEGHTQAKLGAAFFVASITFTLAPHLSDVMAYSSSPEGARNTALRDFNASWAAQRLPQTSDAAGYDLWAHALLARRANMSAQAEADATKLMQGDILHEDLLLLEGNLLWERQDFERARGFFEQAVALAPSNAAARYNLSVALLSLADPVAAQTARSQAFAQGGLHFAARVARAQSLGQMLLDPPVATFLGEASPTQLADAGYGPRARGLAWAALSPTLLRGSSLFATMSTLLSMALLCCVLKGSRFAAWMLAKCPLTQRCSRCHQKSCPKCTPEAHAARLCGPCHAAALGLGDNVDSLRQAQEAASLKYHRGLQRLQQWATWLCPGAGVAIARSVVAGQALFMAFVVSVMGVLWSLDALNTPWVVPLPPGAPFGRAVLCALFVTSGAIVWLVAIMCGGREH